MAFVLEQITLNDHDKILRDAASDPEKLSDLLYASERLRPQFPSTWAIDREYDSYLFLAPILTRRESLGSLYFIYFNEHFYAFEIKSPFGNEVQFVDAIPMAIRIDLEKIIQNALDVYGRSGNDLLNEEGVPVEAIQAKFVGLSEEDK